MASNTAQLSDFSQTLFKAMTEQTIHDLTISEPVGIKEVVIKADMLGESDEMYKVMVTEILAPKTIDDVSFSIKRITCCVAFSIPDQTIE